MPFGTRMGRFALVSLATAAAVIASQALISGAFSVTKQVIQLGFLPRLQVRHTSATRQIYIPCGFIMPVPRTCWQWGCFAARATWRLMALR